MSPGPDGKSDPGLFKVCFLRAFRDTIRTKEVWVDGANRYRDPKEDVPSDFEDKKNEYYKLLKLPREADTFIREIQSEMHKALAELDASVPKNSKIKIRPNRITVSPLKAQPKPPNLRCAK